MQLLTRFLSGALRYLQRCKESKQSPRPRGTFATIPARISMTRLHNVMENLKAKGILRDSPDVRVKQKNLVSYNTNEWVLVDAKTIPCHQAAMVSATACTLEELGKAVSPKPSETFFNLLDNSCSRFYRNASTRSRCPWYVFQRNERSLAAVHWCRKVVCATQTMAASATRGERRLSTTSWSLRHSFVLLPS